MPGTHNKQGSKDKAVTSKSEIRSLTHSTHSEILLVHKIEVKPEQQQQNLGSFAHIWP
jgi:hypothetical protein